jgi:hypothetical protein
VRPLDDDARTWSLDVDERRSRRARDGGSDRRWKATILETLERYGETLHRNTVLLEDMHGHQKALAEAMTSMEKRLTRRFDERFSRVDIRLEAQFRRSKPRYRK